MDATWLPTLTTDTPQAGFDLAIKLSRMGVKATQPSDQVRAQLRTAYDHDSAQLIAASQVIALNFQTVAAANDWWRDKLLAGSERHQSMVLATENKPLAGNATRRGRPGE